MLWLLYLVCLNIRQSTEYGVIMDECSDTCSGTSVRIVRKRM